MSPAEVRAARGKKPRGTWSARVDGKSCTVEAYTSGAGYFAKLLVLVCDGAVASTADIDLSAAVLSERLYQNSKHGNPLASLSLDEQSRALRGEVGPGDKEAGLRAAFGPAAFRWRASDYQPSCEKRLFSHDGVTGLLLDRVATVCSDRVKSVDELRTSELLVASRMSRVAKVLSTHRSAFESMREAEQWKIFRGVVAKGAPAWVLEVRSVAANWKIRRRGQICTVHWFGGRLADWEAVTCGGLIVELGKLRNAKSFTAVSRRNARLRRHWKHFSRLSIADQRRLLSGNIHRGDRAEQVYVAFGRPYRTGTKVDESGTTRTQVYLDGSGDYVGLTVTFKAGVVSGWAKPAQRRMTPEAKRRIAAERQRKRQQLAKQARQDREAAERARRQAAEERQRAERQRQMLSHEREQARRARVAEEKRLAVWRTRERERVRRLEGRWAREDARSEQRYRAERESRARKRRYSNQSNTRSTYQPRRKRTVRSVRVRRSSAQRTIRINGRTYRGGAHLGRSCSLKSPCPSGYACTMVTKRSGQCTQ